MSDGFDGFPVADASAQLAGEAPGANPRRSHRLAFIVTVLVVGVVLVLLPVAIVSMAQTLGEQESELVFNLFTGEAVDAGAPVSPNAVFVNLTVKSVDEAEGIVSIIASGHQVCPAVCPQINGTIYSLGSDRARRHGLPPSADSSYRRNQVRTPSRSSSRSRARRSATPSTPTRWCSASPLRSRCPTA